jgi:hypothetical protein
MGDENQISSLHANGGKDSFLHSFRFSELKEGKWQFLLQLWQ